MELEGKNAVITGAASGIGRALTEAAVAAGMRVVMADVEEPRLLEAADEVRAAGGEVTPVVTDVSDGTSVDALAAAAEAAYGPVHLLCNNAGVGGGGPIHEFDPGTWEWVLGVNLWGVLHGVRAFYPHMVERNEGHVVNTASIAGIVSFPNMGPYNVSKHGVVTLSETMHQELAALGSEVGVSVLCPGFVNTQIIDSGRNRPESAGVPDEVAEEVQALRQAVADRYAATMAPSRVAEMVLDAVRTKRFYVFTDDQFAEPISRRHRELESATDPSPTGELWEHLFSPFPGHGGP